ncbi:N-acetyl-D-Glu racemase DgcA [Paracoccaceae bacterium GXU_MW_L88]
MKREISRESFPLKGTFAISRGARTHQDVLTLRLADGASRAWAECTPYGHNGETLDSVTAQIESIAPEISRAELQDALPPGAARAAIDNALWDLEAKQSGKRVWELMNLPAPKPVETAFTLSLASPEGMEEKAREAASMPLLKVKLGGDGDVARIEGVRRGVPNARIIVDANEGWSVDQYLELMPVFERLGIAMVEQPFKPDEDDVLLELPRPVPVCADEACHTRADLPNLKGKYDFINIKMEKTGGLTEALALRDAARAEGFKIMVGCMMGTSLGMAPGLIVAQGAEIVDLDGPLWMKRDRDNALKIDGQGIHPPARQLWG